MVQENFKFEINGSELDLRSPVVMTILNVTPDSFWSDSRRKTDQQIEKAVDDAVAQGAKIIDIGGYSSRPGAAEVSPQQEIERVSRGVQITRERAPEMVISIDTFRSEVATAVIDKFGECIINDISAGELDKDMISVVAQHNVPYIAMHMRATPQTMQQHTEYEDIVEDVASFFAQKIEQLISNGVEKIIIDPGFGFAKTTRQNHQLMKGMESLTKFGYPVLSGISRKSMIYNVLNSEPKDALAGTCALNWESLVRGASILRVHDTREANDIVKLFNYYNQA